MATANLLRQLAGNAPNLWGQVYLSARAAHWDHEPAMDAATDAAREFGAAACSTDDLAAVLHEVLRHD